jgi:hypothetical protein
MTFIRHEVGDYFLSHFEAAAISGGALVREYMPRAKSTSQGGPSQDHGPRPTRKVRPLVDLFLETHDAAPNAIILQTIREASRSR